jgi:excinuclease ABC subunit A
MVELLFLPSVYAPCPTCGGARYNADTLAMRYEGRNIAEVLAHDGRRGHDFFAAEEAVARPLQVLREVGLGYLRLGQSATELSGGEAQRIKLATELQRATRGGTLYILDEPTTGLHPLDADRLLAQLQPAGRRRQYRRHGRTHDARGRRLRLGDRHRPGRRRGGRHGGRSRAAGARSRRAPGSRTAPYLAAHFTEE